MTGAKPIRAGRRRCAAAAMPSVTAQWMREALIRALERTDERGKPPAKGSKAKRGNRRPTQRIHLVAEALVARAIGGDLPAIKEVFARIDGRGSPPANHADNNGNAPSIPRAAATRRMVPPIVIQVVTGIERSPGDDAADVDGNPGEHPISSTAAPKKDP